MDDRTEQPVVHPQRETKLQQFIIGNDETESDLSMGSRSFVNRVNDQVRKRQKTIFDECHRKRRKTFHDMGKVHVCNIGISSIRGNELLGQSSFHHEYKRPHIEKMFDISAILVSEQDEISGVETIGWENHSWKYLSLIGDERVINL